MQSYLINDKILKVVKTRTESIWEDGPVWRHRIVHNVLGGADRQLGQHIVGADQDVIAAWQIDVAPISGRI